MRLSPDGRFAALTFHRGLDRDDHRSALGVTILDLETGEVVLDETIVDGDADVGAVFERGPHSLISSRGAISGLAWDDERTLRVAWYEVPDEGVHWLADVVQVSTFSVP